MTWALATVGLFIVHAPAHAQVTSPSPLALETVAAIDESVDGDGNAVTGLTADALASFEVGRGLQVMTRPFLQRLAATGEWNAQIWMAALRYEHPGERSVRIDAGLIPSPVGLGNLLLRPHLNPTIAQPSSLFTPLPPLEARGPRAALMGALYPLGASVTVSSPRWDVRGAVIDVSPLRPRRVFADATPPNPPRFATTVVGGGITPFVGFRIGTSVARGDWQKAGEAAATDGRMATTIALESEFAYRFTRLLGEWVRNRMETAAGHRTAHGFFVQGQQVIAPRWFVAARVERISAPVIVVAESQDRQRLLGIEETVGYRVTPELTLRFSHRARETFGAQAFTHTAAVSAVFWKRWW